MNTEQKITSAGLKRADLARIGEHDVLPGQLEQHGVVEELVDRDILGQTLSPSGEKKNTLNTSLSNSESLIGT